jgi:hypothetical protein
MTLVPGRPDPKFSIERVPLDRMFIDVSYQRPEYSANVEKFANDWSDVLAQVVMVARRPEGFAVVDGQTRRAAAMLIGKRDLYAQVLEDVDVQYEALCFAALQSRRTNVRAFDLYRAERRGGLMSVLEIDMEVTRRGLVVAHSSGDKASPDAIAAVVALKEIHDRGEAPLVGRTLDVIRAGFPRSPKRFRNEVLRSVARLLHEPDINDWRLVLALEAFAKGGDDGAEALINAASHRRQSTPQTRGRSQGGHSEGPMVMVLRESYTMQRKTRPRSVPKYVD